MSEWFHAKVKYLRQIENGLIKQVTEQYLVDSASFTDCEARVFAENEGAREITCQAIARSPIKEIVFYGDTDLWFKVKVTYSLLDEETEKEKKITTYLLVNANDAREAYDRTEEHLKEMLVPFQIPKVETSPIIDVFQYQKQAPKGFTKISSTETTGQDAANKLIESKIGNGRHDDGYNEARRLILSRTDAQKTALYNYAHNSEDDTDEEEIAKATGLDLGQLYDCVEYIHKESNGTLGEEEEDFGDGGDLPDEAYDEIEGYVYKEGDEHEEHCDMETDAVEGVHPIFAPFCSALQNLHPKTDNEYIDRLKQFPDESKAAFVNGDIETLKDAPETPFARKPDPTSGQAVAFDAGIVDVLSALGLENLTIAEIEQLSDKAKTLSMIDFCIDFWLWQQGEAGGCY